MTLKTRIIGIVFIFFVLIGAFALFSLQQEPTSDDEEIAASEEQEVYSPEEWKAHRIAWDYFQAQQQVKHDPNALPIAFPKDLNLEHLNMELFVSEGLRYYEENSPVLREARETIEMVKKRMPEVIALYEESKRYNENLPQMKLERERQRQQRREIQMKSEANTAKFGELHAEVLELLRIVEEPERLSSTPLDEVPVRPPSVQPAKNNVPTQPAAKYNPVEFLTEAQSQLQTWRSDLDEDYFDVVVSQSLSPKEFEAFFPTKESRAQLQVRQQQMQADIARRVQGFLAEDTSNRKEKLSIIRKTLSENWSPDIAEGVLERLK